MPYPLVWSLPSPYLCNSGRGAWLVPVRFPGQFRRRLLYLRQQVPNNRLVFTVSVSVSISLETTVSSSGSLPAFGAFFAPELSLSSHVHSLIEFRPVTNSLPDPPSTLSSLRALLSQARRVRSWCTFGRVLPPGPLNILAATFPRSCLAPRARPREGERVSYACDRFHHRVVLWACAVICMTCSSLRSLPAFVSAGAAPTSLAPPLPGVAMADRGDLLPGLSWDASGPALGSWLTPVRGTSILPDHGCGPKTSAFSFTKRRNAGWADLSGFRERLRLTRRSIRSFKELITKLTCNICHVNEKVL